MRAIRWGLILLTALVAACAPRAKEPLYYSAENSLRRGDLQDAVTDFKLFITDPGPGGERYVARAYYMLAFAYYRLGQCDETIKTLDEMEGQFPRKEWTQVWALRGDCSAELGQRVNAVQEWDEAWRLGGGADRQRLQRRLDKVLPTMSIEELTQAEELVSDPTVHDLVLASLVKAGGTVIPEYEDTALARARGKDDLEPFPDSEAPPPAPHAHHEPVAPPEEAAPAEPDEGYAAAGQADSGVSDDFEPPPPTAYRPRPPEGRGQLEISRPPGSAAAAPAAAEGTEVALAPPSGEGELEVDHPGGTVASARGSEPEAEPAAVPAGDVVEGARIACLVPLTGADEQSGLGVVEAVRLAFRDRPELLVEQDAGDSPSATHAAWGRIARDARVAAVIAWLPDARMVEIADLANRSGMPLVALSERAGVSGRDVRAWGMPPTVEINRLLDYAVDTVGVRRMAVIYPQSVDGRDAERLFTSGARDRKAQIVGSTGYTGHDDWSAVIDRVRGWRDRRVNVEAVFVPDATPDVVPLVLALNRSFPDLLIFGRSSWAQLVATASGAGMRAFVVGTASAAAAEPGDPAFAEQFRESAGRAPTAIDARAYRAASALEDVVAAGATRAAVRDAVESSEGATSINAAGGRPVVLRLNAGKAEATAG